MSRGDDARRVERRLLGQVDAAMALVQPAAAGVERVGQRATGSGTLLGPEGSSALEPCLPLGLSPCRTAR